MVWDRQGMKPALMGGVVLAGLVPAVVAVESCRQLAARGEQLEARINKLELERLHASVFYEENTKRLAQILELRVALLKGGLVRSTGASVDLETGQVPVEVAEVVPRLWYCVSIGAGILGGCFRNAENCSKVGNCVAASHAWCFAYDRGKEHLQRCSFEKTQCEASYAIAKRSADESVLTGCERW